MRTILLIVTATLIACGGGKDGEVQPVADELSGCNPIDPTLCSLPWPSSYYQVASSTPSGMQNAFPFGSLPGNRDGAELDPAMLNEKDGFATLTPMVTFIDNLNVEGIISHTDLGAYLADDARTLLINANTGERVMHFGELDSAALEGEQSLMIRPVVPLEHSTRYIVALSNLVHNDGSEVSASPAFAALRDNTDATEPDVDKRREHFETNIFPALQTAGFPRDELLLAWDFTTGSAEVLHKDILHIRDDAAARIPADGPTYTFEEVTVDDCSIPGTTIHKTIEGTINLPHYMTADQGGSWFARGDDGLPAYQGDTHPPFLIRIPCSLADTPRATPLILQYGHGLLGDRSEAYTGWLSEMANTEGWIVFAMDWTGMNTWDAGHIMLMLSNDLSDFRMLPERSQQGFIEFNLGLQMMQTSMVGDPELIYDGVSLLEGSPTGYYGNSQGGILGGAYLGMATQVDRGVLGVAGMPYSLLLQRSADFGPFFMLFQEKYPDSKDITLLMAIMQTLWDAGEPSGYANVLTSNPLPGTPAKDVLIQVGIGDAQVTTLGAHVMARAYGATTVNPQTRPIYGVEEVGSGYVGSALVEFNYIDVGPDPIENLPPLRASDTHECPRREPWGQVQIRDFLVDGVVNHTCDGPCNSMRQGLCD